jgi:rare lipoprotein A
MASWYGKKFHGRTTASGEVYNMYQTTAAHRTAPLGSYALVTNLDNGQAVQVRINDRGPHVRNRILDLSYGAARQLDIVRTGSGRVKVEFFDQKPAADPPPEPAVAAVEDRPHTIPVLPVVSVAPFTVQAGAYQAPSNAARAQKALMAVYPQVSISVAPESAQSLHRVRLGPFQSRDEAEKVVHRVRAHGYAAVVVAMAQ